VVRANPDTLCHVRRSECQEYNILTIFKNALGLTLRGRLTAKLVMSLIGKERHSSKIGPIFIGAYYDGTNHCLEVAKAWERLSVKERHKILHGKI
jgi:hypothetical protein